VLNLLAGGAQKRRISDNLADALALPERGVQTPGHPTWLRPRSTENTFLYVWKHLRNQNTWALLRFVCSECYEVMCRCMLRPIRLSVRGRLYNSMHNRCYYTDVHGLWHAWAVSKPRIFSGSPWTSVYLAKKYREHNRNAVILLPSSEHTSTFWS